MGKTAQIKRKTKRKMSLAISMKTNQNWIIHKHKSVYVMNIISNYITCEDSCGSMCWQCLSSDLWGPPCLSLMLRSSGSMATPLLNHFCSCGDLNLALHDSKVGIYPLSRLPWSKALHSWLKSTSIPTLVTGASFFLFSSTGCPPTYESILPSNYLQNLPPSCRRSAWQKLSSISVFASPLRDPLSCFL